jgi:vanillate O-demethylase monooxygenase subunit
MGDPALADPDRIPDFHWLDDPGWGAKGDLIHAKCHWQLIVDNLLDLTHLAFLHETTIGNTAVAEGAKVKVERGEDSVRVTRWMIDSPAPPTYVKAGGFTANVDRWQIIDWTAPGFVRLDVGATPTGTGAPEGRRVGGINMRNLNAITPETERTTHYFWAQAHDFDAHNPATTELVFQQVRTAFLQDWEVFEAQQRSIDAAPDAPEIDLAADAGALQARRIVARLLADETGGAVRTLRQA